MELIKIEQTDPAAYDLPGLTSCIFHAARQGMILADARGRIIAATGYRESELLGHTPEIFEGENCGMEVLRHIRRFMRRTGHWERGLWCCRKDGTRYPQPTSFTPLPGVTEYRRQVEALTRLAFFAPLTVLPNHTMLMDRLGQALVRAGRRHSMAALLFVDLDGFKAINDGHGRVLGDTLLQMAATRLRSVVRAEDTVARYGGDEFALLFGEIGCAGDAVGVADKVGAVFVEPFVMRRRHARRQPPRGRRTVPRSCLQGGRK